MDVELTRAPITAANFLRYVDGKYYDGGVINRAVRPDNTIRQDVPIQVISSNPTHHGKANPYHPFPWNQRT